jgi:hypothetical protein
VDGLAADVADAGRDPFAARAVDLGDRDARALARRAWYAGAADPGTGAGDDRDLSSRRAIATRPYLPISLGW